MSSERRRYRARVHTIGSESADDSNVDFTIDVGNEAEISRLVKAPIVGGQTVHPLQGRSDMRPFEVSGIDFEGTLTEDLSQGDSSLGRWVAIGRLVSVQYQEIDASGSEIGAWVTYGTGRCTQLDELDGPGKLNLRVGDESWKLREGRIFEHADTTQLWPAGVTHDWRGFPAAVKATGARETYLLGLFSFDNYFLVGLTAEEWNGVEGSTSRGGVRITENLLNWIRADLKPVEERIQVGDTDATSGNFRHLRLRYGSYDYEVVTFANPREGPILESLEEPEISGEYGIRIWLWVMQGSNPEPPQTVDTAFLWAPEAPPSEDLPLHVGLADSAHLYGTQYGFIHMADLTRRVFDALGLVYDPDNLTAFEADKSFPALSPRVTELPTNPLEWLQKHIWALCGVTHGRDVLGRLKLIDLRPPRQIVEYTTVLDPSNARKHTWRLDGMDQINSVQWKFLRLTRPPIVPLTLRDIVLRGGVDDDPLDRDSTLDNFFYREETTDPDDGDTLADSGRRVHLIDARAAGYVAGSGEGLFSQVLSRVLTNAVIIASGAGSLIEPYQDFMTTAFLNTYQDGPIYGEIEVHGDIGDTIEEGDVLWISLDQFHIPTPGRLGVGLPGSVAPQNPGGSNPALESPPTLNTPSLNTDLTISVSVTSIPVTQVQARVEYAAWADPSEAPPEDSQAWLTACVRTTAGACTIPRQDRLSNVWIRVSGEDSNDLRLSSYSTPVVVEVPDHPRFDSVALNLTGGEAVVTWDANALTQGVLVEWAIHAPGVDPETYDYSEVDADLLTFTVPDTVPVGSVITVRLTAYTGFDSGGVDSPPGETVVLSKQRSETLNDALDHALGDHTDTQFETPVDGDVVQWDETLAKYIVGPVTAEAAPHDLDSHTDVNTAAATNGQVLTKVAGVWVGQTPTTGATTLDGLTDVEIDSPDGGDILEYIESDGLWWNRPPDLYVNNDFPQTTWGGRLCYRTDRNILYFYEANTARWLSVQIHTIIVHGIYNTTASANGSLAVNPFANQYDLFLERVSLARILVGTGNWTPNIVKQSGATQTTFVTGSAYTNTTWETVDITVTGDNSIITSDVDGFFLNLTENSGTASAFGVPHLVCRLIG